MSASDERMSWLELDRETRDTITASLAKVVPNEDPARWWSAMRPADQRDWLWHYKHPAEYADALAAEVARIEAGMDPETQAAYDERTRPRAWDEPVELPNSRNPAPFPAGLLGDVAEPFVAAVAEETATPVELAGLAALGVCSTVIAGAVVVEPVPGWREPVNLYLNVLAAPGEGKTPAVNRCTRVLDAIQRARMDQLHPTILDAKARKRVAEGLAKQAEDAAVKAKAPERVQAEAAYLEAVRAADEVAVPHEPRLHTKEATPEGLVKLLAEQGGRLGVITDEGVEFFELAARYSRSGKGNFGIYLCGHDGTSYLSDRSGRESIWIPSVTLSVVLFAQPIVLGDLGADRQARGRGLLARFLWSMPRTLVGHRPVEREPVDGVLLERWEERISSLAAQAFDVEVEPAVLRLDLGARQRFDEWRRTHEPRLAAGSGDLAGLADWGSKLPGQVLRLAGNLHALRTGTIAGTISADTMTAALAFAAYFVDHTRVVFAVMGADAKTEDASTVLRWLQDRDDGEVTTRALYRSKKWEPERARAALSFLEDYGWVRRLVESSEEGGRPSERWGVFKESGVRIRQNPAEDEVLAGSDPHFPRNTISADGAVDDYEERGL